MMEQINNRIKEIINELGLVDSGNLLNNTQLEIIFDETTFDYNISIITTDYAEYLLDGTFIQTLLNDQILLDYIAEYLSMRIQETIDNEFRTQIKIDI